MSTNLSIKEAAEHFGISESTVRRRIKDGILKAYQQPTTQGYEWRIVVPDEDEQVSHQDDDQVATVTDHIVTSSEQVLTLDATALVAELRRLHDQNVQLAGQVGYLQAQLQQAQERIRLLEAPKEPEEETPAPQPEPEPPSEPRSPLWQWVRRKLSRT